MIRRWLPLESPPGLAKTPIADFIPRVPQSVNVGWSQDAAFITRPRVLPMLLGQVITLWEPLPYALGIARVCSTDLTWELVRTAESQAPAPVSPNLYFNKIFRWFVCTFKFEKHSYHINYIYTLLQILWWQQAQGAMKVSKNNIKTCLMSLRKASGRAEADSSSPRLWSRKKMDAFKGLRTKELTTYNGRSTVSFGQSDPRSKRGHACSQTKIFGFYPKSHEKGGRWPS